MSARKPVLARLKTIEDRIETQRRKLFQASAIVGIASEAANATSPIDGKLSPRIASDIRFSLELARELIEGAAGAMEFAVIAAPADDGEAQS